MQESIFVVMYLVVAQTFQSVHIKGVLAAPQFGWGAPPPKFDLF